MTLEQKQIEVAKTDGFSQVRGSMIYDGETIDWAIWSKDGKIHNTIPDYFNDQNESVRMTSKLRGLEQGKFIDELDIACGSELSLSDMLDGHPLLFSLLHATPQMRMDAYGRTLNLW